MRAFVLDAGALIALERGDRELWADLEAARALGSTVVVPAGVVAQVWRDGRRQARLARALMRMNEAPLDGATARLSGAVCGRAGTSDVIDAMVAVVAASFGPAATVTVATSDRADIESLLAHLGAERVNVTAV